MSETIASPMQALTVDEVCRRLGIARPTLYERIFDGLIRARKCGRRTIIMESDLQAYLDSLPPLTKETRWSSPKKREVPA